MFVKHAWLTFYYGLARTRVQRYFIHFMQFTAAAFGISSVLVVVLQCIPLNHVWRKNILPNEEGDARCINLIDFFYFNSIFMIVNDVVMYMMPMWLLWKVDMLRGHRMGVYALFCVGGLYVPSDFLTPSSTYTSQGRSRKYISPCGCIWGGHVTRHLR